MTAGPSYCPNCGANLIMRKAAGRQRPVCPECGYVVYQNPIPAVGILIEMGEGLVLIRRGVPPAPGQWALPSGFVEADESVELAAIREAKEETGLDIALKDMVGVYSFPDGPPTSGIVVFYRAVPVGGTLGAGDDAADARVYAPDDIPELPFRTHRQALATWRARREVHLRDPRGIERQGFLIREASPEDVPRILALAALLPGKLDPDPDMGRAVIQRLREDPNLYVFVAELIEPEPQVIGLVTLAQVPTLGGLVGWVNIMVVDPNYRRIGVGAALLEAIMRRADFLEMAEVFVNTARASDLARAFYRASGFQDGAITYLRLR